MVILYIFLYLLGSLLTYIGCLCYAYWENRELSYLTFNRVQDVAHGNNGVSTILGTIFWPLFVVLVIVYFSCIWIGKGISKLIQRLFNSLFNLKKW